MPEIEIRPAVMADWSQIIRLDHDYQSDYVWQMDRISDDGQINISFREIRLPRPMNVEYPRTREWQVKDWGQEPGLLVAVLQGQVAGYISIKENDETRTAWVSDIVVDEPLRRKGIGSALLIAGQDWAVQRHLYRMVLEMQSKNHPMINLARKLGFELAGYHDQYFPNRDIALFFACFLK